ncbi:S49 family peptidase [Bradyrhizobium sp. I71]|uniref:S49 family peptidase n=1 Tax=Bradyrhizobium sp. I71 TaxID=2590772 RepID=UPI001EF7843D|nr:S49 family peptidase [Bradyrhizobium sp. I71]ULK98856.1 S49 family peptidase [Bradyrhizobium sp. I71]
MRYMNIIMACAAEPWALEKGKLVSVAQFLKFKAAGGQYSAEEVARVTQKRAREVTKAEGSVAVLPINGVIGERMNLLDDISGGTSSELIGKQLSSLLNDTSVKAIIARINSPGGVARSIQELGDDIYNARGIKPMVAVVDTCAASAAYWLATQFDEVIVTPSGQAGSIGVYTIHEDISEMLAKEGIKETLIYSGEYKVMGNSFEPLGDEAKTKMQQNVDELAAAFVRAVARGRNVSLSEVNDRFGQGMMFNADELLERGMVDTIATFADTLERFGVQTNPALSRAKAGAQASAVPDDAKNLSGRLEDWARRVNAGEIPPPSELEAILRDAGASKTKRTLIASRALASLRSESGDDEAEAALADAFAELRQRAMGFTIPKL